MIGTLNFMPEAPRGFGDTRVLPRESADLLSDVLRRVHLASGVILDGEFSAPWAFCATDHAALARIIQPGADRLVLMHVAVEGSFRITVASGETALAKAGDAVVLPYCDDHSMGYPDDVSPVSIAELVPKPPWKGMPVVRHGGGGAPTRILCGYLHCDDLLFNPVLRVLPRLLHLQPTSGHAARWREASVRYAFEQAHRSAGARAALLARLPELVLVDCLRQYVESLPAEQTGWLAALKDSVLGPAMVLLHAEPAERWTVSRLARRVAVSRSILAERFTQALGVSPMRYLGQWRLQIAADLLRTTRLSLANVAGRVGYDSDAAFSRAFKRGLGVSPAAWRERRS